MLVVNESVYLKKVFQAVGPRPWPRSTQGRGHLLEAEATKNWPRGQGQAPRPNIPAHYLRRRGRCYVILLSFHHSVNAITDEC